MRRPSPTEHRGVVRATVITGRVADVLDAVDPRGVPSARAHGELG